MNYKVVLKGGKKEDTFLSLKEALDNYHKYPDRYRKPLVKEVLQWWEEEYPNEPFPEKWSCGT
jgi:hypothetical protein